MVQPERPSNLDVATDASDKMIDVMCCIDVLSLLFETCDEPRTFSENQCSGIRVLLGTVMEKAENAADGVEVLEARLRLAEKAAEPQIAAYEEAWALGTEIGAACARVGEDHRVPPPPSLRARFRGWTGDQPPAADQPVYPKIDPVAPEAEEPDALRA